MPTENENSEIIYTWNCNTVDVYPIQGDYTNVIYNVHYNVIGGINYSTQPIIGSSGGTQLLNTDNVASFIPFDQLTSEQTVAWTKSAMGEAMITEIENDIANQIESLKNPISITKVVPDPPHEAPIM
jgi:hypothetical protein